MILAIVALFFFYLISSIAEGFYFHGLAKSKAKVYKYQHWVLVAVRVPVWILFYLVVGSWCTAASVFLFSFIHDGIYYWTRNKLNPFVYTKGFWDSPNPLSSNAVMDFNLIQRSLLGLVGILIIVLLITGIIT